MVAVVVGAVDALKDAMRLAKAEVPRMDGNFHQSRQAGDKEGDVAEDSNQQKEGEGNSDQEEVGSMVGTALAGSTLRQEEPREAHTQQRDA